MVNVRTFRLFWPALVLAFPLAGPAWAGDVVLYRCLDRAGNPAYTNQQAGFRDCKIVGQYARPPASPAASQAPVSGKPSSAAGAAASASSGPTFASATTPAASAAPVRAGSARRSQQGAVYRYERNGVAHYTNVAPRDAASARVLFTYDIDHCIACDIRSPLDWNNTKLRLEEYSAEIARAIAAHGVDEALVRAVIHAESAYRVNARSHKGAQGLMQLMPATAARFGVTDAYDPAQNIAGGVEYLAFLLRRFDGDITLAAAGYNAGEGAVARHGGVPPYAETRVYVQRVGLLRERYRAALDEARGGDPGIVAGASP